MEDTVPLRFLTSTFAATTKMAAANNAVDVSRGCRGYEHNLQQNWYGNVKFGGAPVIPSSVDEMCQIVATANPPIRVVGRGHSFTPLAECSGGTLISLIKLNKILDFVLPTNGKLGSITVEGGATYTDVIRFLDKRGALRNLPSCPQFTVAGAIATATHGSGVDIPNLAGDVSMLEFITSDGTREKFSRDNELLNKVRVHLGCLGIISTLTLDIVPYFEVEAIRYDNVLLEYMIENLPKLWKSCDSLSVWSSGMGEGHGKGTCWMTFRHFRITPASDNEQSALRHCHEEMLKNQGTLCDRFIRRYCTDPQKPVTFNPSGRGPWFDMLTVTMQDGVETSMQTVDLQAEFFVPLESAQDALRAVWNAVKEWKFSSPWGYRGEAEMGDVDALEFRQVKGGDDAYLSPHPVNSLGIHFSFNRNANPEKVQEEMIPAVEMALEPFSPRAHWGKLGTKTYDPDYIEELFGSGLDSFRNLCMKHDPNGNFRNDHLNQVLFHK
jgi:xylitol oxidase